MPGEARHQPSVSRRTRPHRSGRRSPNVSGSHPSRKSCYGARSSVLLLNFPKTSFGKKSCRERESSHHSDRWLRSCARLECSLPTCSSRGAGLKLLCRVFRVSLLARFVELLPLTIHTQFPCLALLMLYSGRRLWVGRTEPRREYPLEPADEGKPNGRIAVELDKTWRQRQINRSANELIVSSAQLEYLESVGAPDLESVRLADGSSVEPDRRVVDVL